MPRKKSGPVKKGVAVQPGPARKAAKPDFSAKTAPRTPDRPKHPKSWVQRLDAWAPMWVAVPTMLVVCMGLVMLGKPTLALVGGAVLLLVALVLVHSAQWHVEGDTDPVAAGVERADQSPGTRWGLLIGSVVGLAVVVFGVLDRQTSRVDWATVQRAQALAQRPAPAPSPTPIADSLKLGAARPTAAPSLGIIDGRKDPKGLGILGRHEKPVLKVDAAPVSVAPASAAPRSTGQHTANRRPGSDRPGQRVAEGPGPTGQGPADGPRARSTGPTPAPAAPVTAAPTVGELLKDAQTNLDRGQNAQAIRVLLEARSREPTSTLATRLLCSTYTKMGNRSKALRECQAWERLEQNPRNKESARRSVERLK